MHEPCAVAQEGSIELCIHISIPGRVLAGLGHSEECLLGFAAIRGSPCRCLHSRVRSTVTHWCNSEADQAKKYMAFASLLL